MDNYPVGFNCLSDPSSTAILCASGETASKTACLILLLAHAISTKISRAGSCKLCYDKTCLYHAKKKDADQGWILQCLLKVKQDLS